MPTYLGAHIARRKTIEETFDEIRRVGGNALQIFVASPRSGRITAANFDKYITQGSHIQAYLKTNKCKLFIHSAYTLNFAKALPANSGDAYWVQSLMQELRIAHALGADGVVIHMGKHTTLTPAGGVKNMHTALSYVLRTAKAEKLTAKLLLETSLGMGTELLRNLDDFLAFYKTLKKAYPKHVRICFDTAHVWSAGYDPLDTLSKIPAGDIALIQMNNSKRLRESRIDRHANLQDARAKIPLATLKAIVQKSRAPIILETLSGYRREIPWMRDAKNVVSKE